MWGEWVKESEVYNLLDIFYDSDFRAIDIATNYPINGKKQSFKQALIWLNHWCQANQCKDLEIYLKIGSNSNQRTNEINLSSSFLAKEINEYLELFTSNLSTIGIHWDNRGSSSHENSMILKTLETVYDFKKNYNLNIGFSGIKNPEIYKPMLSNFDTNPMFQVKENLLTSKSRKKYMDHFEAATYIAYGINFGSSKRQLSEEDFLGFIKNHISGKMIFAEEAFDRLIDIKSISEFSILYAELNPHLTGYIIAPSSAQQLKSSIKFIKALKDLNLSSIEKERMYSNLHRLFDE